MERCQSKTVQGLQKKVKDQDQIKLPSDIMTLQDIIKKNLLEMTREDVFAIFYSSGLKGYSTAEQAKKVAEQWADMFIDARNKRERDPDNYAVFEETLKIDIALATGGPMPPKRFATNCYFPRR
jgi:hypothetical protein